jgi:hypothetical protein
VSLRALPLALAMAALAPTARAEAPQPPAPEPARAVHDVLANRKFQFCHDGNYPLTPSEKQWCEVGAGAGENAQACPKLREACKNDALANQLDLHEPFSFHLPELGLPVRLLLWLLLGLGVGLLIFALVRHFLDRKAKEDLVTTNAPEAAPDDSAAALARQVETDVQRLLERARIQAAAGNFREAIGDVYAALLRRLEGAGVVRVEPDQTNGDYLRKVKVERPTIARRMEEVVDVVESAQFGEKAITREGFDGAFSRVLGILAERIGIMLLAGGLLALASACGQPRDDWEHSPSGRAGVIDYLGKRGFKVHERLLSVAKIADAKAEQLVLLPDAQLGEDDWKAVMAWVLADGHSLVVAGSRRELPAWIGVRIIGKQAAQPLPLALADAPAKRWGALRATVPEANYLEDKTSGAAVLTRNQATYAAERWLGPVAGDNDDSESGRVLVLADDFLFRNASLLVGDNAALLDNLLRDGGTNIELAGDLTGLVATNPVQSVERGRLGPALLQLAAFLLVLFVCKGARFGRPVQSERGQRRAFIEHVRALGLHYARARAERHALAFMGPYAVERLRERTGAHADRGLSGLAEAVATRTGRPLGEVMRVLLEARDASKDVPADKGARDLETVAELCKLLEETGGSGGHKRVSSHV